MPARLKEHNLNYLASPYRGYPNGIEAAYEQALNVAGELTRRGVRVFSPIVHSHRLAQYADVDPCDNGLWMDIDRRMAVACDALVVACLPGWMQSAGIAEEMDLFEADGKPVYYLHPRTMEIA